MVRRNLGLAYARSQNNIRKAIGSLEKSVAYNKEDPILYYELDELYEVGGLSPRKRLKLLKENQKTVLKRDDVFLRQIILYVVLGQYDKALNLLMNHHFYVREGEEVRVHNVYVDAHLLKGRMNFRAKRYQEALKDYEAALECPEDLGTGKPYDGGRAPEVYYLIGNVYEPLGETAKAREFYKKSVVGKHDWASVIGQVIDWAGVCYHQGLAFRKLNQKVKSDKMFDGLLEFGKKRLKSGPMIDFFAKFGGRESEQSRLRHAHYTMALGYLGKGRKQKAMVQFEKVLKIDPSHIGAITQLLDQGAPKA